MRHPGILDAVESVIGPDIICWTTNYFIKEARDSSFVSWHQDSTYWGLEPPDVVTAWPPSSSSGGARLYAKISSSLQASHPTLPRPIWSDKRLWCHVRHGMTVVIEPL